MDFNKMGILEIDGERLALRPLTLDHKYGENPILEAELMNIFQESNARSRRKIDSKIEDVIFNDPATIVKWSDGTKTVVKCQPGDTYDKEIGLAMCICKKFFSNKGNYNEVFKQWIPEEKPIEVDYYDDAEPLKAGTHIRIIDACFGATGANGKTGVILPGDYKLGHQSGLLTDDPGYLVILDNGGVWKIGINAKIEIIE